MAGAIDVFAGAGLWCQPLTIWATPGPACLRTPFLLLLLRTRETGSGGSQPASVDPASHPGPGACATGCSALLYSGRLGPCPALCDGAPQGSCRDSVSALLQRMARQTWLSWSVFASKERAQQFLVLFSFSLPPPIERHGRGAENGVGVAFCIEGYW
jgi:hypothetical protein